MRTVLAALLTAALALSACGGGSDETADETTTTTSADAASTTSSSTSTSTTEPVPVLERDEPPELANTGEDFEAIITSLFEFRAWLLANPDADLIDPAFAPGSPIHATVQKIIEGDVAAGQFTDAPGIEYPTEVRVTERPDDDVVLLFVAKPNLGYDIVKTGGEVVESVEGGPDQTFIFELRRDEETWRLAAVTSLS